ncbi:GMC family oxidoreductase [Rhodanobacter soli]|uniref:Choline dehydrogenase-like flavoprotein n=1 Tax=Rhodanobacter soli TaxID=590609 RepID=A0ABV2PYC3_9GAMM
MNSAADATTTFDAIVIGSGISGGWAAKELCDKGLKTLVLERGRNVTHVKDYPTANLAPWQLPHRGALTRKLVQENPVMSKIAAEDVVHFFVKDAEHPYVQERPFDWIRGYQVGGKSIMWGRACQRWSRYEFEAPERDGYGIAWPIGYDDIAPWYSHVEKFIGVCGTRDGIESMPDGEFLPPFDFNCVEQHMSDRIRAHYGNRHVVHGRWAHLTRPEPIHLQQGRSRCLARNLCWRGCPFGAYFSSNSSTLPWAEKTGNLTLRPDAVVHSIIYDERRNRATGVRVIDANTHAVSEYRARIVFVNASALNTVLILFNSVSARFPHGLGNDNGLLGKYVAFQNYRASGRGFIDGFDDKYYFGRRPSECILANFRNLGKQEMDFVGGYTTFTGAYRERGAVTAEQVGGAYKDAQARPGPWKIYMYLQGETIPKEANHVRLHETQKDEWGMPLLVTSVGYDDNDEKMVRDWRTQATEMLGVAGCRDIETVDNHWSPGRDIHEMGGCRMGRDPETSLLNRWNQLHACPNVFVTDGACMTSTGNQSPSLLYMALTARAVNHAVEELGRRNL